ncbi:1-hydroxycarotenoid 3,4-desaturase CrtD [Lacibacter sediminis]|uniref:Phytoene desaturase n=1 Tax=Lacibacter sediminis TaxID=2760713 RepID=A0A7G5XHS4_9BACT|nr:1-hydroxycarotenoid 3,4-desaturase CrtD [Lacibacter sediminis]QNA45027.1 phytoene desaturase [Lacibacter sediminis]
MQRLKAVVIGSGVAGLAGAIRLAVMGYEVDVFERNAYAGGKLSFFEKDGFLFDAGPSLFTQPQNIEELFAFAGEPIEDYFQYRKVDLSCNYFFENGKRVKAWTDAERLADELHMQLGEDKAAVLNYLRKSETLYNNIGSVFLNHSLHKRKTWFNKSILKALQTVRLPHLTGTLHGFNQSAFKKPETIQLFDRFATYNGSNPYQTPGMMSLIPHLELNEGTFYPEGGMISITNALVKLAEKKGVRFHFNSAVQRIIQFQGEAKGVVVNDENVFADVVLSNADIYFTYHQLLADPVQTNNVLKQERSCSGMIFYWGMKREFPELHLHNIFFSKNYAAEFNTLFQQKRLYNDPTVYVNITSKMEEGLAPKGKENWFLLINAPSNVGQNWEQMRIQLRQQVIDKLSRSLQTDIASAIETEEYLDPIRIEERTGSFMGSLYGTSSNSKMAAFLRHPNFTNKIEGLYFCGGSVHPGGGIPLCFKSAKIATELIHQDQTKHAYH